MKRVLAWAFGIFLVLIIGGAFAFLYKKSQAKPVHFETESPEVADITKKTVATGSIVPRREVEVKPKVTGVLSELYVEPGKIVKQGDPLGKISIIADAMQVNQADSGLRTAQIAFDNAKRELARNEELYKRGVVADAELQRYRTEYALREQELTTAGQSLQLVKEGATRSQGKASTLIVTATADGMVIDVPVKVGFSVIQANNFNPGTTIAVVADMADMIFEGRVDEAEVAKIKEGMKLAIKVGAIEKESLEGKLEYIAPKGKTIDGAIQFEIKAAVAKKDGSRSARTTARTPTLWLDEKAGDPPSARRWSSTTQEKPFVEVETSPQTFVKKDVKLGLSDGIKVEVLGGVAKGDKIKIPETAGPPGLPKGQPGGKPPAKK